MLENLCIENFKAIHYLEIKKLSQFTLIGGKNNTGKSTLMEAMFMLLDKRQPAIPATVRHGASKGLVAVPNTSEFMFEPIFHEFDLNEKIKIKATYNGKNKSLEIEKTTNTNISLQNTVNNLPQDNFISPEALSLIFKDGNEISEKSTLSFGVNNLNLNLEFSTKKDNVISKFIYAMQPSNQQGDSIQFGKVERNNKIDIVLKVIQIIVPEIKTISISILPNNISMIYADIGKAKRIPISYMGDGVIRLLSIVLAIATCENGIVFIDEIENGLHYSVIKDIWKGIINAAKAFNCQVIATTHSDEFLDLACEAMKEINIEKTDFSYIKLQRDENKIYIGEFDYELFDYAVESNMEIR